MVNVSGFISDLFYVFVLFKLIGMMMIWLLCILVIVICIFFLMNWLFVMILINCWLMWIFLDGDNGVMVVFGWLSNFFCFLFWFLWVFGLVVLGGVKIMWLKIGMWGRNLWMMVIVMKIFEKLVIIIVIDVGSLSRFEFEEGIMNDCIVRNNEVIIIRILLILKILKLGKMKIFKSMNVVFIVSSKILNSCMLLL